MIDKRRDNIAEMLSDCPDIKDGAVARLGLW